MQGPELLGAAARTGCSDGLHMVIVLLVYSAYHGADNRPSQISHFPANPTIPTRCPTFVAAHPPRLSAFRCYAVGFPSVEAETGHVESCMCVLQY